MKVNRRTLFGAMAGAAAVPVLAFVGVRRFGSGEDVIVAYLRRELPGLAVLETDMRAFATEYARRRLSATKTMPAIRNQLVLAAMNSGRSAMPSWLPDDALVAYGYHTRELMTTFLFSTDFFTNAERKPDKTAFVAFADPYAVGCRNPLGRFGAKIPLQRG